MGCCCKEKVNEGEIKEDEAHARFILYDNMTYILLAYLGVQSKNN